MVARLSIATISIAALVALAAACGGGDKAPGPTPTGLATARLTPSPTPTLAYTRLVKPVSESDAVWDEITARVSGNLSPVLRPPSPPEGFDTVQLTELTGGPFIVEYKDSNKLLRLMVGAVSNPPPSPVTGHSEKVIMRGLCTGRSVAQKDCPYLHIWNDANPKESSFLIWYEPGREVISEGPTRDSVEYLLSAEGVEPQFLIDFAKSLTTQ